MASLGGKLRDLRVKRGLTQDELCDKVNETFGSTINKGMVSKWENDVGEPRLETARLLALFYGISLDELLGLPGEEVETMAAHHEGDDWTDDELEEIEKFKEFVKSKRKHQE